ncbi:MAG: hypothetical protein OXF79_20925 [Chloroflexi bacterium]|nr:hypothetical protein [Chloroflexota bacterium]
MACAIHEKIDEYEQVEKRLLNRLEAVREQKRILRDALRVLDQPADTVVRDIEDLEAGLDGGPLLSVHDVGRIYPRVRSSRMTPMYLDVARSLALLTAGRVHVADVAREIKTRGLSDAKHSSLCATISRAMSKSEKWEHVEPGTFVHVE